MKRKYGGVAIPLMGILLLALLSGCTEVKELPLLSEEEVPEEKILIFLGEERMEQGETVPFRGELNFSGNQVGEYLAWEVESLTGDAKVEGSNLVLLRPGKVLLRANFLDLASEKEIEIFPVPYMKISMKSSWIHPGEWYALQVETEGLSSAIVEVQSVLGTDRKAPFSNWEKFEEREIVINECGNYLLIAEAKAESDGRKVIAEKAITVTPYVERGFHDLSWEQEDMVQLRPSDLVAIQNFISEDLKMEISFSFDGKVRKVNRISSDYIFYKDSSRKDTLLYQKQVFFYGEEGKDFFSLQVKGEDGRYLFISWNNLMVSVNRGSPGSSYYTYDGGDSSAGISTGGGGGPSPSPPI
jgi:hypothetical protein